MPSLAAKKSLSQTLILLKLRNSTNVRVWWESRHPLPLTHTTEHSGNCWLTVPSHNHAAMQNHHLPTRLSFAPVNHNTYSHAWWQRYYHLKIIVFFLTVTLFFKKGSGDTSRHGLCLWPPQCICNYWHWRELEGRGPHQKAPCVLIDMHQLSLYRLLQLLVHWKRKRQESKQALSYCTGTDEKPTAFSLILLLCWALGKQDKAAV